MQGWWSVFSVYFYPSLAILCFNESSLHVTEDQEIVIFALNITNPASSDSIITVVSANGAATGEAKTTVYIYILRMCVLLKSHDFCTCV